MLQNFRFETGLKKYEKYIRLIDTSRDSKDYFRIYNLNDKFLLGKNSFRINANTTNLVNGSTIYIDILDANGDPIYHEISNLIGKDRSRLVISNIYSNTAPGIATIYIAGRMRYNTQTKQYEEYSNDANSWDNVDIPNVMWKYEINIVPNEVNNNEIVFYDEPKLEIQERQETYKKIALGTNRINTITETSSSNVLKVSTTELINYNNNNDKYELDDSRRIIIDPTTDGSKIKSETSVSSQFRTTINISGHTATEDWIGARIKLTDLESSLDWPNDVDPSFTLPTDIEFTSGIIDLLDQSTFVLDKPFTYELIYLNTAGNKARKLYTQIEHGTYEIQYYRTDITLEELSLESFVEIDLIDIEPIAGDVTQIEIGYKEYGSFGEFTNLGKFKIPEQNFLVDPEVLVPKKIEIKEKPIWDLSTLIEYNTYWNFNEAVNTSRSLSSKFVTGLTFSSSDSNAVNPWDFDLKSEHAITGYNNTEYKLQFDCFDEDATTNDSQIDIYVSSPDVFVDLVFPFKMVAPKVISGWTHIGSVQHSSGALLKDVKLYFKLLKDSDIRIKFVARDTSKWSISNLKLFPRNEAGYSPNHANLKIPLQSFKKDNEISLHINYLNDNNKKAKQETTVYGLIFTGEKPLDDIEYMDGEDGDTIYTHIKYSNDDGTTFTANNGDDVGDYIGIAQTTNDPVAPSTVGAYTWSQTKGDPGNDGSDGVSSYTHRKYSNDNGTTFTGNGGDDQGNYLGILINANPTASSTPGDYEWSKIVGDDGADGTDGNDATERYTWIAYANNITGTAQFTTGNPSGHTHIGFAYNKLTSTEGTNPAEYTWSLIKGSDGTDGADGLSSYTHQKYSDDSGTTFTSSNGATPGKYIGFLINSNPTASNTPGDYTWSQVEGDNGLDGNDGTNGSDGNTSWIRYSNDNGTTFTPNNGQDPGDYLGTYIGLTESTNVADYTWKLIKGDDGADGTDGNDGLDATERYTWIKYGDSPTSGMSDSSSGKTYIGISYNNTSAIESTVYADYEWSKYVGDDGNDGNDGTNGSDGTDGDSSITCIRYSNDNGLTFTSSGGTTPGDYLGTVVVTGQSPSCPVVVSGYTWTLIKGGDGNDGADGTDGNDATERYTWTKYADSPTTGMSDSSTGKMYIGIAYNKTTSVESTTYSDYEWTKFVGDDGADGTDGNDGNDGTNGTDGDSSITCIRYSNDNGATFTGNGGLDTGDYIGVITVTGQSPTCPIVVGGYTWSLIKGTDGTNGTDGNDGTNGSDGVDGNDGDSSITCLRYSNDNGVTFTSSGGTTPGDYLGTAVITGQNPTCPITVGSYSWALIKGSDGNDGNDGTNGNDGNDGVNSYVHIKYSDDNGTTFTSNGGDDSGDYLGTATTTSPTAPSTVGSYSWALIKGEDAPIPPTPNAPTNLILQQVGTTNNVQMTFTESSTSEVNKYEIYNSIDDEDSYALIGIINKAEIDSNVGSTFTLVDSTLGDISTGDIFYNIIAYADSKPSNILNNDITLTQPTLDVTNTVVTCEYNSFTLNYNIPTDPRVKNIKIYLDKQDIQANLSQTNSLLVYTGMSRSYTYQVLPADLTKFHQFYIEVEI